MLGAQIHQCKNRDEHGNRIFKNDAAFFVHGNLDFTTDKVATNRQVLWSISIGTQATDFDPSKIRKINKKKKDDAASSDGDPADEGEEGGEGKRQKGGKKRKVRGAGESQGNSCDD